ncbi:MAG: hypothetical protein LGL72_15210 [Acidibrevibacterium sp.]|jgi:hypothetical protein|uniref:hypothetical protein n=1 Tax=Acidibrevibacterium fodinaquatile TaxID=1969806 RepID=UPI0023A8D535|nr:hypothetical protein [Acidibrevibacterium fodinaquatile]MCA7120702.1 hypothetical protein [Acidibrevibacterium fodinaquatile]
MDGEESISSLVIGVLMVVFGLIGLTLAAGALDIEMAIFGWSLAGFSVVFLFGLIRRHFDDKSAARAAMGVDHG